MLTSVLYVDKKHQLTVNSSFIDKTNHVSHSFDTEKMIVNCYKWWIFYYYNISKIIIFILQFHIKLYNFISNFWNILIEIWYISLIRINLKHNLNILAKIHHRYYSFYPTKMYGNLYEATNLFLLNISKNIMFIMYFIINYLDYFQILISYVCISIYLL